jgi:hypothetical protein
LVTVAGDVAFPLLMLGLAQLAAVASVAEAVRVRTPCPKSIDDELDELLTDAAIDDAVAHDRRSPDVTGSDNPGESTLRADGQTANRGNTCNVDSRCAAW